MILTLSGGKQQRISIAKVSHMILADELTGSLDRKTENEILKIFKKLAKEDNKCVIIVTHSQNVCENADVIYKLYLYKKKLYKCILNRRIIHSLDILWLF